MSTPHPNPSTAAQSPPRQLVALLRCPGPDGDAADLGGLVATVDDWPALFAKARAHRVLQLLALRLEPYADEVPEAQRVELEETRNAARRTGMVIAHSAAGVLADLSAHGVAAAAFKGQAVAVQAYGDPLTRPSVDLDVLVDRDDRARAAAVLMAAGYHAEVPLGPSTAAVILRGECEQLFHRPGALGVELHWSVVPPSYGTPLPATPLLRNSEPIDVLGWTLPTLCLEDAVVVAAVHGYKHFWQCLEHAVCLAGLLASPALDAAALLARARELHAVRRTLVGASVAAAVSGAALAPPLAAALEGHGEARQVTALAVDELWGTLDGRVQMREIGRSTMLDVRALDRPADVAACVAAKLVLPRLEDREWRELPDRAAPLYYALRPARLGWSLGAALVRRGRERALRASS